MLQILISSPPKRPAARRGGFTLIEILVAVAIMSLLLGIILVPLRLGFDTYHIGKARAEVQQEAQLTMQQLGTDLRRSQFIFANSKLVGVTQNPDATSPCSTQGYKPTTGATGWDYQPYARSTSNTGSPVGTLNTTPNNMTNNTANFGVCDTTGVIAWSNRARIDMLQLRRGSGQDSKVGQDFIVSYYPRRRDITRPYDVVDNPVVLYRAQIPFRYSPTPGDDYKLGSDFNAQIDWSAYPDTIGSCNAMSSQTNRSFSWITHNLYGEANLEPLTTDAANATATVAGAHTLATPLGMSLVTPRDVNFNAPTDAEKAEALVPELSFTQEATTGSRINRVKIDMTLALYDQAGAGSVNGQGKAQRVHVSQTFDLPSAGCTP